MKTDPKLERVFPRGKSTHTFQILSPEEDKKDINRRIEINTKLSCAVHGCNKGRANLYPTCWHHYSRMRRHGHPALKASVLMQEARKLRTIARKIIRRYVKRTGERPDLHIKFAAKELIQPRAFYIHRRRWEKTNNNRDNARAVLASWSYRDLHNSPRYLKQLDFRFLIELFLGLYILAFDQNEADVPSMRERFIWHTLASFMVRYSGWGRGEKLSAEEITEKKRIWIDLSWHHQGGFWEPNPSPKQLRNAGLNPNVYVRTTRPWPKLTPGTHQEIGKMVRDIVVEHVGLDWFREEYQLMRAENNEQPLSGIDKVIPPPDPKRVETGKRLAQWQRDNPGDHALGRRNKAWASGFDNNKLARWERERQGIPPKPRGKQKRKQENSEQ